MDKTQQILCEQCGSRKNSLFCHLNAAELTKISHSKTCNTYKKGQVVFHEGNHPMGLFCIQKGKVKIYKMGQEGREQIVRMAGDGGLLGYRSLVGEEPYSATAQAIENSSICFIDKQIFLDVLKSDKILPWDFMKFLCRELRQAEEHITEMAQKSVRERLAEDLIILKNKYGYDNEENRVLNVSLKREELASFVGTATETLIRLLSDMRQEKVIDIQGQKIKILDEKKLLEIANLET